MTKGIVQAIILAAGKSTRTHPLTVSKPKAMLKVANKTIIEHNLESLNGLIKEAVIVIGFEAHQVTSKVGYKHGTINISYTEQLQQLGTGDALKSAEKKAKERFLVLMGDDIYSRNDIKKTLAYENALLMQKVPDITQFGTVREKKGYIVQIQEKQAVPEEGFANTGCYTFSREIFSALKKVKKSERGEYELTDAVNILAEKGKIRAVHGDGWHPITYPWSLLEANETLLKAIKGSIKGTVEKGAVTKGAVSVGKGTVIKAGSYIEGPVIIGENSSIGPNCYIRACTSIGNNCLVGNATEVKNSILMDGTHAGHLSYVGDSILAENVNLGAGTITANLRHDNNTVKSVVKGVLIDTKRRKLGAIIGENVHTGIHTTIYPGRKIWQNLTTAPGEVVKNDVEG